ncbi:MAG TPA: 3-phosphoshikimate 1-carboxyvinyltransferase [Candidatus Baltobacteraceae bacterium]
MNVALSGGAPLRGELRVPGDKSIAHRALIFGSLAHGWTRIAGLPRGEDVASTIRALGTLGVAISRNDESAIVMGRGPDALDARGADVDCGNSGTTMRLLMGALAGGRTRVRLTGDASLSKRPMRRVSGPLAELGARVHLALGDRAPLEVEGTPLAGANCELKLPSAQVKSALLLAALRARGTTRLTGMLDSRDHTERMLPMFGARLESRDGEIVVEGGQRLRGAFVRVPGDASSAAFWIAAGSVVPGALLRLRDVGVNPTRLGFVRALTRMGAKISVLPLAREGEPVADITVEYAPLHAIELTAADVPDLIDELPLLAVVATQATGRTVVRGASELRVKESDRIEAVARFLRAMGATIETFDDGFAIEGPQALHGAKVQPQDDHRIAMAGAVAGLVATGETIVADAECASVSYPEFFDTLGQLAGQARR